ncbi:MAG TPA: hypothetical protein VHT75_02995 [Acidimicrobiales bacterium]|nr:hypothetical protein [Acidimicrobiales bacterium]
MVLARLVRPTWGFVSIARLPEWIARLPADDPLLAAQAELVGAGERRAWGTSEFRRRAVGAGVRLIVGTGIDHVGQLCEMDLAGLPMGTEGADILDGMLCELGVFDRGPLRGTARRKRTGRLTPEELAATTGIPERFQVVTALYLATYASRLSDKYPTLRHKASAVAHF